MYRQNRRSLDRVIPTYFDQINRGTRSRVRIYASTEDELVALRASIPNRMVKGEISDWCFVTISLIRTHGGGVFLTGSNNARRSPFIIARVAAIDNAIVILRNGATYKLIGEPSTNPDLVHICSILNGDDLGRWRRSRTPKSTN